MPAKPQSLLFRGIYEFEDPSGSLLAARIPPTGSTDLFAGTAVVVRPNQCAIFVYQGQIADILGPGTHQISSENVPLLTRLTNWKFGFQSPLRCDLWFFSGNVFTARRWGTAQPVLTTLDGSAVPVRSYGNYNIRIVDPRKFLTKLVGSRSNMGISEVEEFIQGHVLQQFPLAIQGIKSIRDLSVQQKAVGQSLEAALIKTLAPFGITIAGVQVLSLLPPQEVIEAMDSKLAMDVIGDKKEYLLYKAASTMEALQASGKGDPMHMMMGLMLGKSLMGADYKEKEEATGKVVIANSKMVCTNCKQLNETNFKFCSNCGKELS